MTCGTACPGCWREVEVVGAEQGQGSGSGNARGSGQGQNVQLTSLLQNIKQNLIAKGGATSGREGGGRAEGFPHQIAFFPFSLLPNLGVTGRKNNTAIEFIHGVSKLHGEKEVPFWVSTRSPYLDDMTPWERDLCRYCPEEAISQYLARKAWENMPHPSP